MDLDQFVTMELRAGINSYGYKKSPSAVIFRRTLQAFSFKIIIKLELKVVGTIRSSIAPVIITIKVVKCI